MVLWEVTETSVEVLLHLYACLVHYDLLCSVVVFSVVLCVVCSVVLCLVCSVV